MDVLTPAIWNTSGLFLCTLVRNLYFWLHPSKEFVLIRAWAVADAYSRKSFYAYCSEDLLRSDPISLWGISRFGLHMRTVQVSPDPQGAYTYLMLVRQTITIWTGHLWVMSMTTNACHLIPYSLRHVFDMGYSISATVVDTCASYVLLYHAPLQVAKLWWYSALSQT